MTVKDYKLRMTPSAQQLIQPYIDVQCRIYYIQQVTDEQGIVLCV
jgi:hypothetical protein